MFLMVCPHVLMIVSIHLHFLFHPLFQIDFMHLFSSSHSCPFYSQF